MPIGALQPPHGSMIDAVGWSQDTLVGPIASTIAVLAMAVVGLLMLSGRMPLRRGATIVIGCFVLFSAATIAEGLLGSIDAPAAEFAVEPPAPSYSPAAPRPVPEDPYAGAAVPTRR